MLSYAPVGYNQVTLHNTAKVLYQQIVYARNLEPSYQITNREVIPDLRW
jgi:hypothetical protein